MAIIVLKDETPTDKALNELKLWRRDAKKSGQTALYDLLTDVNNLLKGYAQMTTYQPSEGFTWSPADEAFSTYSRARANHCCERCGKSYPIKTKGLQCSHHFSRRHFAIRFDPDNALALCHHCHNYWYSKDVPEAADWLEQKLGKERLDRLKERKKLKCKRPTASQLDEIAINIKNGIFPIVENGVLVCPSVKP